MKVQEGQRSHEGSGPSNRKEKGTSPLGIRAWGEKQPGETVSLCRLDFNLPKTHPGGGAAGRWKGLESRERGCLSASRA